MPVSLTGYRDPRRLRKIFTLAMGAFALLSLVLAIFDCIDLRTIDRLIEGADVAEKQLENADERRSLFVRIHFAIYAFTVAVYLVTVYVLARNARALSRRSLNMPPAMAILWYFVPPMNVVMPYLAMQQIWRASAPYATKWQDLPPSVHVKRWWAFWILWWGMEFAAPYLIEDASITMRPENVRAGLILSLIVNTLKFLSTVAVLNMICRIVSMQSIKFQLILDRIADRCASCGESLESGAGECMVCGADIGARAKE